MIKDFRVINNNSRYTNNSITQLIIISFLSASPNSMYKYQWMFEVKSNCNFNLRMKTQHLITIYTYISLEVNVHLPFFRQALECRSHLCHLHPIRKRNCSTDLSFSEDLVSNVQERAQQQ